MSKFKVNNGFLCDDVRRENNGKLIAIGIYGNRIFVGNFPCVLNLMAFVNVSVDTAGEQRFKTRLLVDDETRSEVEIASDTVWAGSDWYPVPVGPIGFEKPSTIHLQWKSEGGKWKSFASVPIEIGAAID